MKPIGDRVKNYQPLKEPDVTQQNGQRAKVAETFWTRMASLYGHKWTSAYGSSPDELWTQALTMLDSEQIRRGLAACVDGGEAWPPSLPEFMALCRPAKRENAAMYSTARALPAPRTDPTIAREQLAKIRSMVRK